MFRQITLTREKKCQKRHHTCCKEGSFSTLILVALTTKKVLSPHRSLHTSTTWQRIPPTRHNIILRHLGCQISTRMIIYFPLYTVNVIDHHYHHNHIVWPCIAKWISQAVNSLRVVYWPFPQRPKTKKGVSRCVCSLWIFTSRRIMHRHAASIPPSIQCSSKTNQITVLITTGVSLEQTKSNTILDGYSWRKQTPSFSCERTKPCASSFLVSSRRKHSCVTDGLTTQANTGRQVSHRINWTHTVGFTVTTHELSK